jgi:hypothetical protein
MKKFPKYGNQIMGTKEGHAYKRYHARKHHAKINKIPFTITFEYAFSLIVDICPILGIKLSWCEKGRKNMANCPSLDRIVPKKGYVEGNIAWISNRANVIKNDGTAEEHLKVAEYILHHETKV